MKERQNHIYNEKAYFKKVIKNMDSDEWNKNITIEEHEVLTDEIDTSFADIQNEYNFYSKDLLGWIELIENENLYKAVIQLTEEEQTLLSYIFNKRKTQSEVAKIHSVKRQTINEKISKIINKIKAILCNK